MRFCVLNDDEDDAPVKRMVFAIEQVSNGFIMEVNSSVYVFKTRAEAFAFLNEEMNKNYEALNVR